MSEWPAVPCGDDLISITARDAREAQIIAEHLRATGAFREAVAGIASVVVQFDASGADLDDALSLLDRALAGVDLTDDGPAEAMVVPVVYGGAGGPDLEATCKKIGLSRTDFIALHTGREYRIDMLGFTPGFAYVGGLDASLDVPRLAAPRPSVPAGSVGIAGGRTGIYALRGPGGWPLIGRTALPLFDADAEDPFLLKPGMSVRFEAVDESGP